MHLLLHPTPIMPNFEHAKEMLASLDLAVFRILAWHNGSCGTRGDATLDDCTRRLSLKKKMVIDVIVAALSMMTGSILRSMKIEKEALPHETEKHE